MKRERAIMSIFFMDIDEMDNPTTDVITSGWMLDKLEEIFVSEIASDECLILSIKENETEVCKRKAGGYEEPIKTIPLGYGKGKKGSVLSQSIQNLAVLPAYCYGAISGNKKDFRKTTKFLLKAMKKQKSRMMDDCIAMDQILKLEKRIERTEKALKTSNDSDLIKSVGQIMITIPKDENLFKYLEKEEGGISVPKLPE